MPPSSPVQKICKLCHKDVSAIKRVKDDRGNYFCAPCYVKAHSNPAKTPAQSSRQTTQPTRQPPRTPPPEPIQVQDELQSYDPYDFPEEPAPAAPPPARFVTNAPACPKCKARLLPNAAICTACGLNVKTGRRLGTKSSGGSFIPPYETHAFAYNMIITTFLLLLTAGACSVSIPACLYGGLAFLILGAIINLVSTFWWAFCGESKSLITLNMILLIVLPITSRILFAIGSIGGLSLLYPLVFCGLLNLVVDLMVLVIFVYRLVTHWSGARQPFALWLQGLLVLALAVILLSIGAARGQQARDPTYHDFFEAYHNHFDPQPAPPPPPPN